MRLPLYGDALPALAHKNVKTGVFNTDSTNFIPVLHVALHPFRSFLPILIYRSWPVDSNSRRIRSVSKSPWITAA